MGVKTRYDRLMGHFDAACDLTQTEQSQYLGWLRDQDATLAQELAGMLAIDSSDGLDDNVSQLFPLGGIGAMAPTIAGAVESAGPVDDVGRSVGPYLLEATLGRGGAGAVYQARSEAGEPVAVKLLDAQVALDSRQRRRFQREFRAASMMSHPACVEVIAAGVDEERMWYAMELAGHGDLYELATASTEARLAALVQLAAGLDALHARQVVHRDLKPENVLLFRHPDDPRGVLAKLTDFGIAHAAAEVETQLTNTGVLMGTLSCMAPEQALGRPVDPRSDLYALGCIVHLMWAGRPPFEGGHLDLLRAHVEAPPPLLAERAPDIPPELAALTSRLLAKRPEDRPQSAAEVFDVLVGILRSTVGPAAGDRCLDGFPALRRVSFLRRPPLLGRDVELAQLVQVARTVAQGAGGGPALRGGVG